MKEVLTVAHVLGLASYLFQQRTLWGNACQALWKCVCLLETNAMVELALGTFGEQRPLGRGDQETLFAFLKGSSASKISSITPANQLSLYNLRQVCQWGGAGGGAPPGITALLREAFDHHLLPSLS